MLKIKPGSFLIVDVSSARGGVTYNRDAREVKCPACGHAFRTASKLRGHVPAIECPACGSLAERTRITTIREVDHKAFVKDGNNLVQSDVRCILRNHCANTSLGWVCERSELPALTAAYETIAAKASEFNASASRAGSSIHVRVGFVPVEIGVDNAAAAAFLAATIREVCAEMIAALTAGNRPALAQLARKAKNLDRLAADRIQRASITFAIENFREARGTLNAAARESGLSDESRHDDGTPKGKLAVHLATVGAGLDVEALEACCDLFSPGMGEEEVAA